MYFDNAFLHKLTNCIRNNVFHSYSSNYIIKYHLKYVFTLICIFLTFSADIDFDTTISVLDSNRPLSGRFEPKTDIERQNQYPRTYKRLQRGKYDKFQSSPATITCKNSKKCSKNKNFPKISFFIF